MATTTNYSWTTPDDTDLVKDGAAAIRTLGSSADTTVKDLNPGTTAGDIDYYTSSTAKARIAIGTAGQILQVNAGATAPEWVAPAGGGKVLQVVSATTTTPTTIATNTMTDTGITATITPTLATSKILVIVDGSCLFKRTAANQIVGVDLIRAATIIADFGSESLKLFAGGSTSLEVITMFSTNFLDTPATTSATTYKVQANINFTADSGTSTWQDSNKPSTITLMEIGV